VLNLARVNSTDGVLEKFVTHLGERNQNVLIWRFDHESLILIECDDSLGEVSSNYAEQIFVEVWVLRNGDLV
jgi:hypothetical protein